MDAGLNGLVFVEAPSYLSFYRVSIWVENNQLGTVAVKGNPTV